MGHGRAYVAALADLASIGDVEERRRTWRQGLAALSAAVADRRDAPLEGLDPQALLRGVQIAIGDGLVADTSFLSPAAAATALFALAGGLPPGPERRELGRRVLADLDSGDAETFVALTTAFALQQRRPLGRPLERARIAVALSAPLDAGTAGDALALALLAGPELERTWLGEPSQGALASRRLAARILERAARESVRRARLGDDRGTLTLARPSVQAAWARLLADREALVWRHVATARGLCASADRALAAEIDRELEPGAGASAWRRGAASLAARVETDPTSAGRCAAFLDGELVGKDPGVVRGFVTGLGGAFAIEPDLADDLAVRAIGRAGLDAVEAVVELRHDLGAIAPRATSAALRWLSSARGQRGDDDGQTALIAALASELSDAPAGGSLAAHAIEARIALRAGNLGEARRAAAAAAAAAAEAIEFLERADDGDPVERRHQLRTLRELDTELLSDDTVVSLLGAGDAGLPAQLASALLDRECAIETGAIAHRTLRFARLRALVRAVDGDHAGADAATTRERRMGVVRALLPRARLDTSPLRRAVWAALTRAFDALLRDEQLELSDVLAAWITTMDPDDDFAIAREASMLPEVRGALEAYASAMAAVVRAADPDDRNAAIAAIAAIGQVTRALGVTSSPRTDLVRGNLATFARALDGMVRVRGQRDVTAAQLDALEASAAALADLTVGARRRLALPVTAPQSPAALHALALAVERLRRGAPADVAGDATVAAVAAGDDQVPLVARALGVALARLAVLPADAPDRPDTVPPYDAAIADDDTAAAALPGWLPASRTLGGFYVMRPLGKGAGGSVFVACRVEERHDAAPHPVALKVPDYDGGAARNLSVDEFERLFREEAGALLSLPAHPDLAGFITFDAGARPKPILVMEYVSGQTLEQLIDLGGLDGRGALRLCDGILAGLEAMHAARVAHLDLKPANVILRSDTTPVLVDFGLAGRRLRPGCGSPHYGAPEVWSNRLAATGDPFLADVYAFACLAYEILTRELLVDGDNLSDVLAAHLSGRAAERVRAGLGKGATAPLADLLAAALQPRAEQRPGAARLRAGFAAVAPDLARLPWPLPLSS